jgi:hypothetical protein
MVVTEWNQNGAGSVSAIASRPQPLHIAVQSDRGRARDRRSD